MPRPRLENFDEQTAKNYYTAQEAQKRLGMDKDKFNYLVKMGTIKRVSPFGRHGYYRKTDIDNLVDTMESFLMVGGQIDVHYKTVEPEDLDAEIELAALNFGRKRAEATRNARVTFLKANPEITHCLYRYEHMVASLNLIPFTHDAVLEFRAGKRGWVLGADRIAPFALGTRLECIIIDMMTTTRVTPDIRRWYAAHLLKNFKEVTLMSWASQGIDIMTIDACGGTEEGQRILVRAGFEYQGKQNGRDMYRLDVDTSDLPLLRDYKRALSEWKHQHNQ